MEQSTLKAFEARCIQEEPPACQTGCPIHVDARGFIALLAQGKLAEARKLLDRTMPLSGLLGCLCEGPCRLTCRRSEIDEGIDLPLLERFCVSQTRPTRPFPLSGTGKPVSIAGSGLSSLVTAYELAKKGHSVTVFHPPGPLGGWLARAGEDRLPAGRLAEALELLGQLRVKFVETPAAEFGPGWLSERLEDSLAVYLGLDEAEPAGSDADRTASVAPGRPDSEPDKFEPDQSGQNVADPARPELTAARFGLATAAVNPVTLESPLPKVFVGGFGAPSAINAALDGKKAALSIDRSMQGVNPGTMRGGEGPYPTRLYTNLSGVTPRPAAKPLDPWRPTAEEAGAEAERCLQCQCLECVKNCAFLRHYKGYPKRYAREIYNNLAVVQGTRQANTLINSCAECGLCAALCPLDADTGALCGQARDEMVRTGKMPASVHEFALDDMNFSNATDIAFARHQPGRQASGRVFFPGCQLPASLPEETRRVYEHLCANLDGGVGLWFACCGSPARWAARHVLAGRVAADLKKSWEDLGRPEVILACASCLVQFQRDLPEIPVRSLWEVLAELPLPPGATAVLDELALHDPCPARWNGPLLGAIRGILQKLGQKVEELPLSGGLTRCCGYGGLAAQGNPPVAEAMSRDRAEDTPNPLLSYCSMCRDRLAAVRKPSLHALNLLFPQNGVSPDDAAARPAPGISDRQHTRRLFRQTVLKNLWGEEPAQDDHMDKITLHIPEDVAPKLEKRRILHGDLKTVLLHEGSAQFVNAETGHTLSCFRPKNVTFWVEHSLAPDGAYVIHDAYAHRMSVPGVPAAPHDRIALGEAGGDYGDGGFYREKPQGERN